MEYFFRGESKYCSFLEPLLINQPMTHERQIITIKSYDNPVGTFQSFPQWCDHLFNIYMNIFFVLSPLQNVKFFQMHNFDIILCHQNFKMLQWNLCKTSQRKKTFCPLTSIVSCHYGLKPVRPTLLNFNTCFFYSSISSWIMPKTPTSNQSTENGKNKRLTTRLDYSRS